MTKNPPEGYPRVSPYLLYEDLDAMLEWLVRAFGAAVRERVLSPSGRAQHAEVTIEDGLLLLGEPGGAFRNPKRLGQVSSSVYVYLDDVDGHCARARAAGAEVFEDPADQPYGDRRYGVCDPEGHQWYFATRLHRG